MKNIEVKVKIRNFQKVISVLKLGGAIYKGELSQIDTYYNSKNGRLKLREINNSIFQLIYYVRPDSKKAKLSDYEILDIKNDQVKNLKLILKKNLGEKVIVKKKRNLWIYKHTRIHLDKVDKLGNFLELETVVGKDIKQARKEYGKIFSLLCLQKSQSNKNSYSDLLLNK